MPFLLTGDTVGYTPEFVDESGGTDEPQEAVLIVQPLPPGNPPKSRRRVAEIGRLILEGDSPLSSKVSAAERRGITQKTQFTDPPTVAQEAMIEKRYFTDSSIRHSPNPWDQH